MYRAFLTLCWLGACTWATLPAFWLIAHPFADRLRRKRLPYVLPLAFWGAMNLLLLGLTWRWCSVALYTSIYAWAAAAPLFGLAMYIYVAARHGFSADQLTGRHELESEQLDNKKLVIAGIRRRMRHPIYAAYFLMMLGVAIASGLKVVFALWLLGLLLTFCMVRAEDRELERRFGEEFRRYKAEVPAFGFSLGHKTDHGPLATGHLQ